MIKISYYSEQEIRDTLSSFLESMRVSKKESGEDFSKMSVEEIVERIMSCLDDGAEETKDI